MNGYKGALQSDGYQVYDGYDKHPQVTTYNCMAHARRYFFDAEGSSPQLSAHALTEIGLLYAVERELREEDSSPKERRRIRRQKSVPILERFKKWLQANEGLPRSPWGQAVHYSLARWEKLCRYTEGGRTE
ncbi:MAG: transposase, partial [SAR324 cluster bacterium]|nr:transposase [SAR324 cluster bacterium]